MADVNTNHWAPWCENLKHCPDPNRVQTPPSTGAAVSASYPVANTSASGASSVELKHIESGSSRLAYNEGTSEDSQIGYYDISPLKPPVWSWQIAAYFFLGGLSAGAYLFARAAERTGGNRYRALARAGTWMAFAAALPCPVLLIADLGDRKRFHHMLRVVKPSSPMNLGAWVLTAHTATVALAMLRELIMSRRRFTATESRLGRIGMAMLDAVGLPTAALLGTYTGVLISCTANPLWCKNRWLAPLFAASAVSTGAEAIGVAIDCNRAKDNAPGRQALQQVDTAAHAVEMVCMAGVRRASADRGESLKRGTPQLADRVATGAIIGSELLKRLGPLSRKPSVRALSAALGLVAGLAVRWALVYGGKVAAADPRLARTISTNPSHRDTQPRARAT